MIHELVKHTASALHNIMTPMLKIGAESQHVLTKLIDSDSPCMIARFGSVEIQAVVNGMLPTPFNKILQTRTYNYLLNNAGFFPVNKASVHRFSHLMRDDMQLVDVLGSWRIEESFFRGKLKHARRVKLPELTPCPESTFYSHLSGKRILVISPFTELIADQYYNHRSEIWPRLDILPEYKSIDFIKSVNSIGGKCDYESWFEALEAMKKEIERKDFDIALIGCGAYGFPLAAHVKRIGKKAVHVGGSLQLLFGIYGKRWEKLPYINESWTRPRIQDRPIGYEKVEGGCYW